MHDPDVVLQAVLLGAPLTAEVADQPAGVGALIIVGRGVMIPVLDPDPESDFQPFGNRPCRLCGR